MANYYYSGQGSLFVAERNPTTGAPLGFIPIGNVPSLTIDIATTLFEHKESETGQRLTDLVIVKEKKGTFTCTVENLSLDNLALGLWGTKTTNAGAAITDESILIPKTGAGRKYPLKYPSVSLVTVTGPGGTPTYVLNTDYTLDLVNGAVVIPSSGGAINTALNGLTEGQTLQILVDYTHASNTQLNAFINAAAPERWLRFEGLNTVDNKTVIVDIFKSQFDPLTGYGLLAEDLASVEMKGNILADLTRQTGSKFFQQINVT